MSSVGGSGDGGRFKRNHGNLKQEMCVDNEDMVWVGGWVGGWGGVGGGVGGGGGVGVIRID